MSTFYDPSPSIIEQAHAIAIDKLRANHRNYILIVPNDEGRPEGYFCAPDLTWMYAAFLTLRRGLIAARDEAILDMGEEPD